MPLERADAEVATFQSEPRLVRISVLSSSLVVQSQRDCALQPKVGPIFRGYLGTTSGNGNNANGVVAEVIGPRARNGRNRAAVGNGWGTMTQGGSFLAPWALRRNPVGILGRRI